MHPRIPLRLAHDGSQPYIQGYHLCELQLGAGLS